MESSKKSGYLDNNFRLFHLKDKKNIEFEFHYHDFDKIIIFLSGNVQYLIEGKSYYLKPWDILLVNNHEIHKAVIDSSVTYNRIVIWTNTKLFEESFPDSCDLTQCFKFKDKKSFNLTRVDVKLQEDLKSLISNLEFSTNSTEFGSRLLSTSLFVQLLIYLNRVSINKDYIFDEKSLKYDKQIDEIIDYINTNLCGNLSIKSLSEKFFISKYYLMHKFKKETGYTLHNYIMQKRIFKAKKLIEEGCPITKASLRCGFTDYSNFLRAYKKIFNASPRNNITGGKK